MSPPEKLLEVLFRANASVANRNEQARDVAVACARAVEAYAKLSDATVEATAMALGCLSELLDRVDSEQTLRMAEVRHARDLCKIAERMVIEALPPGPQERRRAPKERSGCEQA